MIPAIDESFILGTIDGYEEIGGNLAVGKRLMDILLLRLILIGRNLMYIIKMIILILAIVWYLKWLTMIMIIVKIVGFSLYIQ